MLPGVSLARMVASFGYDVSASLNPGLAATNPQWHSLCWLMLSMETLGTRRCTPR